MRRKRLQHIADTLCHMFCGWQTFFDYNELVKLGNGKLRIDALTGNSFFNDSPANTLSIAKALTEWLKKECQTNKIDINLLLLAQLSVDLKFSIINWGERKYSLTEQFFDAGRQIKSEKMHRCNFQCESIVQTDEKIYKSEYNRIREWPLGWPKNT